MNLNNNFIYKENAPAKKQTHFLISRKRLSKNYIAKSAFALVESVIKTFA